MVVEMAERVLHLVLQITVLTVVVLLAVTEQSYHYQAQVVTTHQAQAVVLQ
jgi:hypothetical protein